jgi:uncharacterized membrane protein YphA (DoxX/SURF4 family)
MVVALVTTYGLSVVGAIVILIVGFVIAGWVRGSVKKALSNFKRVDETLRGFFSSLAYYAVIVFTIIAVLSQFGVETTSFIAVLGAAGLAIGLALQGTLSNVAAGVMLLLFRPFKTGDYIEGGGLAGTAEFFASVGYEPAYLLALAVALVEFVGGLMLVVGLLTRPVAVAVAVFMANAVLFHSANGFLWTEGGFEYPLMWTIAALFFAVRGGGPLSLDRRIGREF